MHNSTADQQLGIGGIRTFTALLVVILWVLPAWAVWFVLAHPEWQLGLNNWQVGILAWYPLVAVLMMFFAVVLYRRLAQDWLGLFIYVVGTVGMTALHWWLSDVASVTLLTMEWATFSLTLFVVGFSIELFRRMFLMATKGHWALVVFGGLANVVVFVIPGVSIAISLYTILYQKELFDGGLLIQMPYLFGLFVAIRHDWRSFRAI